MFQRTLLASRMLTESFMTLMNASSNRSNHKCQTSPLNSETLTAAHSLELLPESLKLNGNIFFKLFLVNLDEKNDFNGLQKRTRGETKPDNAKTDNLF